MSSQLLREEKDLQSSAFADLLLTHNGRDGGSCTHDLQLMRLVSSYYSTPQYINTKVSSLIHLQLIGTG